MTAQLPERLRLDGQDRALLSQPLDAYFRSSGHWPILPHGGTALGRGYVGQWEVTADRLYLVSLHGQCLDGTPFTLDGVFPGYPDRVFAHWYSGELRVALGACVRPVNQGFQSSYERELFLEVRRGVITGQRHVMPHPNLSPGEQKLWA